MRLLRLSLCALVLAWPLGAGAATSKRSKPKPKEAEELSLAELLGKDLAKAVEESQEAYDEAEAALRRHGQRKRASNNGVLRELTQVRERYERALARAREARVDEDNSLARDQVVVSISQSIRALDLITQGLRDDDEDRVDAGVELAGMAQQDLNSIAEGGGGGGGGGDEAPALGPSMGFNAGLSSQGSSTNVSMDVNFSVPLSEAQDIGVGGTLNTSTSESGGSPSGSLNMGGNLFSRYHFLQAFPSNPNWVPYIGAKVGMSFGTQYSGKGLNFTTTDTSSTDLSGQLGMLVFVDRKTAVTMEASVGSSSNTSTPLTGSSTTTSSSNSGLTLGLRRMF